MRIVIGLAVSNNTVGNAMFQACHLLSVCTCSLQSLILPSHTSSANITPAGGAHLKEKREQDATEKFLIQMQAQMGWRTDHIIRDLREQWAS